MMKIFILIVLLTKTSLSFAQCTQDCNTYIPTGGRLGIGTSYPTQTLDVNGITRASNGFMNGNDPVITTFIGKGLSNNSGSLDFDGEMIGATFNSFASNAHCLAIGSCSTTSGGANIQSSPLSGTVKNLYFNIANAPGAGNSWKVTFYVNNIPSSVTCTVSNLNKTCSDLVDTATISAGNYIGYEVAATGTPVNSGSGAISALFLPS